MTDTIRTHCTEGIVECVETTEKKRLLERGMATVEYAIGILAAAALALVLLRIFMDNTFFQTLFDYVVNLIKQIPLPGR